MLQKTEWKYSNEKPVQNDFIEPVEGLQYAVIRKATHDEATDVYKIGLHSFQNGAYINLSYYLTTTNNEGLDKPNDRNRGTMISLTKALYGPSEEGIPYPDDIIGCAVLVDVKKSVSKTKFRDVTVVNEDGTEVVTKQPMVFYNVYSFKPVPASVALQWGNPEQFMLPEEQADEAEAPSEFEE